MDDFKDITEPLLRSAYVEALYNHKEFEFERLTQSYWLKFIYGVARSRSSAWLLEKFPMSAEAEGFRRPAVPFKCHDTSCGPGTIRTPLESC